MSAMVGEDFCGLFMPVMVAAPGGGCDLPSD